MQDDRHRSLAAIGGVAFLLGIVGVLASSPWLGLAAGLLGLVAAIIGLRAPVEVVHLATPAAPAMVMPTAPPLTDDVAPGVHLRDPVTGLFTEGFFRIAVETRVSAARRHLRPVAVVLFEVIRTDGTGPAEPGPIAAAIRATLREADTACVLGNGKFGFVLEDTPEDGAIWTVERLRRALNVTSSGQIRWAGIACYPAHAFGADEAIGKAEQALHSARMWAQDRIEVAVAD